MAKVYLARDHKYDRDVALKVLRPELAAVLGRDRFLAEIRLTAQLDHPHILTLIDSGESDGFLWYVLPYVRGESLRDRLSRDKQLGVEEALLITKQIAGALDYAHRHGVIHRDIKPENILLHEGEAVLTDFGIALAVKEAAGQRLTETGLSLGTPQYMSPEQATGDRQLDGRSDIYSLAAVLYEMLAGEPPHSGPTVQAIIAKLMTERPTRLRVIRDTVPEGIDAAVAKALAKVPADRFGSASELVEELTASERVASKATYKWKRLPATVGGAILITAAAFLAWRLGREHTVARVVARDRTQVTFTGNATNPAISADGKQVAYVAKRCTAAACTSGIEILDLGTGTTQRIVDDVSSAYNIFWSRDRRFLLFSGVIRTRRATWLVSTLGDDPHPISTRYFNGMPKFVTGQDSLVLPLSISPDSVGWVAVTSLGGEYRDSVPIHLEKPGVVGETYVSAGGRWMIVETLGQTVGSHAFWHEYRVVDRLGRQRDALRVPQDGGSLGHLGPDAFWMQVMSRGFPIIRVPFDAEEGRFRANWDTVVQTSLIGFDVTEDGQSVVYSDGTVEYGIWALDLSDALKGNFSRGHKLRSGTSPARIWLSPDGGRVLDLEKVATSGGEGKQIALLPSGGGTEIMHWPVDSVLDIQWLPDGQAFTYAERVAGQTRLVTVDARTGIRHSSVVIPDSAVQVYFLIARLSDGGWAWASGRRVHVWLQSDRGPRVLPLLKDEHGAGWVSAAPEQLRLATIALNSTEDSLFLDVAPLPEGQPTRWAAFDVGPNGRVWWLVDGSLVVWVQESEEQAVIYQVRGPGRVERLGIIPRALEDFSLSRDGRRVALVTRDSRGDVWLARLKRTGEN